MSPHALMAENRTIEEYLDLDRESERKHEFFDGEIFAMSGGSAWHSLIIANTARALGNALAGRPCWTFVSDLRLRVDATGLCTYPDVMVACGELRFADGQSDTLLNPALLVEVLSPTTADYDRGGKLTHYRSIPSVREYLLLEQDRAHAELYSGSEDDRWLLRDVDGLDAGVQLSSLEIGLEMGELYRQVTPVAG